MQRPSSQPHLDFAPLIPANAGTLIIGLDGGTVFYTYIVASNRNGTIYIGSTDDLARRIQEHRFHALGGFTAKYDCRRLVWYESYGTREAAFLRERRLKQWRRSWKLMLIEQANPTWADLYDTVSL